MKISLPEPPAGSLRISTLEMHTGGEPLRVVVGGLPPIPGGNVLEKRRWFREHHDAIRKAQLVLWDRLKIAAEPGGAAVLAALLTGAYAPARGERVGLLICGGNTTAVDFNR